MSELGKLLVVVGLAIAVVGALLWTGLGRDWLGRLPGDLHLTNARGTWNFHFPVVTCLIVSGILTLLLWLFRK